MIYDLEGKFKDLSEKVLRSENLLDDDESETNEP
jgi:hypothetical protein